MPFARFWPDHRAGVELAAIEAHRAAEAAPELEGRPVEWVREIPYSMPTNGSVCLGIARRNAGKLGRR